MYFVDEENNIMTVFQLLKQEPDAFFKLSAIFCSSHNGCHIQTHHTLSVKHRGSLSLNNSLGQTFHNGSFADTGLTDENGIVFLSSTKNFYDALYFTLAANNRV